MNRRSILKGLLASSLVGVPGVGLPSFKDSSVSDLAVPDNASGHAQYWNYKVDLLDYSAEGPEKQLAFLNRLNRIYADAMERSGWRVNTLEVSRTNYQLKDPDKSEFCLFVRGLITMSSEDYRARQAAHYLNSLQEEGAAPAPPGTDFDTLYEWVAGGQHPTCRLGFRLDNFPKSLIVRNYYINQRLLHDYLEAALVAEDMSNL